METGFRTGNIIQIFLQTVDFLLETDQRKQKNICIWSNNRQNANFKKSSFDTICMVKAASILEEGKKLDQQKYRKLLEIFREMGWIVCQEGRFTNTQWIKGKAQRVVTVHYLRYCCLKRMEGL